MCWAGGGGIADVGVGWGGRDQCPEGSLSEGKQIAVGDSETDSVGSCCLPAREVTPALGFHGNAPAGVMAVSQPEGSIPSLKGLSSLPWVHHSLFRDFFYFFQMLTCGHNTEGNSRTWRFS